MNKQVFFKFTRDYFGCFTNFSRHPIIYKDKFYATSEHLYQALKMTNDEAHEKVRLATSAKDSKTVAWGLARFLRPDWDDVKLQIMEEVVRLKHDQHPTIQALLKETGDAEIVGKSLTDGYWEKLDSTGEGENHLGKIWMKIRQEYYGSNIVV